MRVRWLRLGWALGWTWQWPLGLRRHVGLLIGWPPLGMWASGLGRVRLLPWVRLSTLLSRWRLGVGRLLLSRVRSLTLGAVVWSLALRSITYWSLLSIGSHLLSILHARHSPRSAALHSHWVSVGAWRSIALTRVARSLLSPRRGPLLGLLGVRACSSICLAPHLPHWIHGAWRLASI